jgi:phage shock protein A
MAEGGFFSRIGNLWKGFLSLFVGNLEKNNPEAVYEAAINARKEQYKDLKKAVSGIIVLRNKLSNELEEKNREVGQLDGQIQAAVETDEDDVALILLQRKEELTQRIGAIEAELGRAKEEAEAAKASIVTFQAEIEKLEREKDSMLAKKENAEARIQIQDSLSGMSMQADIKALDNVRDHIDKLQAEADVSTEIGDAEIGRKLEKIKAKAGSANARAQLEAMKKARATERAKAGGEAVNVKKSM